MESAEYYFRELTKPSFAENETEENDPRIQYLEACVTNIHEAFRDKDYRRAFCLFVLCLDRLNESEKQKVIQHFQKLMFDRNDHRFW